MKQVYTVETRLRMNQENTAYLTAYIQDYNRMYRTMWNEMVSPTFLATYGTMSRFIQAMCVRFHVLKRTANTLRFDIQGRIKALSELKKLELKNLKTKIQQVSVMIKREKEILTTLKPKVTDNRASERELKKYRSVKRKLFLRQQRLNRMNMAYQKLENVIKGKAYAMCFGSKSFFKKQHQLQANGYKTHRKWLHDFRKKRDANICFLGAKDETAGNQMCQLRYHEETNDFSLQIRKEKAYESESKYIIFEQIDFKYQKDVIISLLDRLNQKHKEAYPLTYRIKRRKNKWYLQVMITIEVQAEDYVTSKFYGVLGVDYNSGFMEVAETDRCGNLINQEHIPLHYHGTGNKAKSEIEEKLSHFVRQAKQKGKDIIIEDLDFKQTKSKQLKSYGKQGKSYNKMLHAFDYSRYKKTLKNIAFRNQVHVIEIPPAYTSRMAKEYYTDRMKLTIHQGASYVIARMGQGLKVK